MSTCYALHNYEEVNSIHYMICSHNYAQWRRCLSVYKKAFAALELYYLRLHLARILINSGLFMKYCIHCIAMYRKGILYQTEKLQQCPLDVSCEVAQVACQFDVRQIGTLL